MDKKERKVKIAIVVLSVIAIGLFSLKNEKVVNTLSNINPVKFFTNDRTRKIPTKEELLASINNFKEKGSVCEEQNAPLYKCKRATTLHHEECQNTDNEYYCSYDGYTLSGSKGTTTITYGSLGTSGELNAGDAFDCDINNDGTYDDEEERFYYVSDYYDGVTNSFDSNYATLIYYDSYYNGGPNHTHSSVYGSGYNSYSGPTVGVTSLPTNWVGTLKTTSRYITNENGTYNVVGNTIANPFSYEGYSARLLTVQEIKRGCGNNVTENDNSLFSCNFLLENTWYAKNGNSTRDIMLENPMAGYAGNVMVIDSWVGKVYATSSGYGTDKNVRPAIEISKDLIQID